MILLHPVCASSPAAIQSVERATQRVAVVAGDVVVMLTLRAAQARWRQRDLRLA